MAEAEHQLRFLLEVLQVGHRDLAAEQPLHRHRLPLKLPLEDLAERARANPVADLDVVPREKASARLSFDSRSLLSAFRAASSKIKYTVEHFQWVDTILKVIKMETTDFYAKMGANGDALPLFQTTALTPMGQAQIGTENRSWSNFTSGTPPAAKFNIAGVATCPMSGNCGQQSLQLRRLSNKQLHTYARYHTTPPATHGLLNQGIIA